VSFPYRVVEGESVDDAVGDAVDGDDRASTLTSDYADVPAGREVIDTADHIAPLTGRYRGATAGGM